jgi:ferredoxin-NADP reductase
MTAIAPNRPRSQRARKLSPLALFEALATPHGVDRYLELVNPMLTVRELRAQVTDVRHTTDDTVTLTLRPTRQWQGFQAGQFVQLSVDIDGVRRTRCFSPCTSQHASGGRFDLTIKAHPGGLVSNYLREHAAPGLVVGLSQASGEFHLPAQRPDRILLISGGSGITPVLSILRTLCHEGYAGEVVFLHYALRAEQVSHRDELAELAANHPNVRVVFGYTEDPAGADLTGFFDQSHLEAAAPWFAEAQTYLCGPTGLMDAVQARFADLGLIDNLHNEDFAPVSAPPTDDATGTVSFARSRVQADNSGTTLLEQAEAAGLRPDFGCRMGICFTCTQVKTSGCTRNIRTGELNADPDTEIQLCINVPVGDVALDV